MIHVALVPVESMDLFGVNADRFLVTLAYSQDT